MAISIAPVRIKQSVYLLVPKNIVELIDLGDSSRISLEVKNDGKGCTLEYHLTKSD